jgi:uncharacterized caspase-like protein
MRNRFLPALAVAIGLLALAGESLAARRALVIGNDAYQKLPALRNAAADARAIADALAASGFEVTLRVDQNEKAMKAALRTFRNQVSGGDEAVFFYSGHGVQLGGANYLLPVDLAGEDEEQVKDEAISLQRVLDDLQEQKARFSLAIIDACRDNPFGGKGRSAGTRGLAPTAAATGQMVMFSAGAGQQALDRLGDDDPLRMGVFTRVLLKEIDKPGVSADRMLRNVRAEVVRLAKSVGHEQVPAIYDQAVGDFYFRRGTGGEQSPVSVPTSAPGVDADVDRQAWEAAAAAHSVGALNAYLNEFPAGRYRSLARIELARLKDGAVEAKAGHPPADAGSPAEANPEGRYRKLLKTIHCPSDDFLYGRFREAGYWGGGHWCGQESPAGHWVWFSPNWYVWERKD